LRKTIVNYSPLADSDDEAVLGKLAKAINSVMRGRVLLAVLQGFLAALGMFIFGVPNAALWGSVAVIAALVPGIGTALVVIPAAAYLFWQAPLGLAIGFLLWGLILVGMVDNMLGPKLLGRGTQVHPLFILLSVLGGISVFGPLGFLLGPLVVSLLFALLEILFAMSHNEEPA
jgi:predicted PurR-regulated permease PerM